MYWVSGARISAARSAALNALKGGGRRRSTPQRVRNSRVPPAERAASRARPHAAAAAAKAPSSAATCQPRITSSASAVARPWWTGAERREGMGNVVRHRGRAVVDRDAGVGGTEQHAAARRRDPADRVPPSRARPRSARARRGHRGRSRRGGGHWCWLRAHARRRPGRSMRSAPRAGSRSAPGRGSTRSGLVSAPQTQTFLPALLVKMLVEENSEPVPAVVGMQILGDRSLRQRPAFHREVGGRPVGDRHRRRDLADVHGRPAAEADDQARACGAHERGRGVHLLLLGLARRCPRTT